VKFLYFIRHYGCCKGKESDILINQTKRRHNMSESVYKIVELVGTSPVSWEDAAKTAVQTAARSLSDLRVAEITKLDLKIEGGQVAAYRARVTVSFRYHLDE